MKKTSAKNFFLGAMVRAATMLSTTGKTSLEPSDEHSQPASQPLAVCEPVYLRSNSSPGPIVQTTPVVSWQYDITSVAEAFLTNESGGAACFSLDLGMVSVQAMKVELAEALGSLQRKMASVDSASWELRSKDDAASTVTIVALATCYGDEIDGFTDTQELTLHIDILGGSCPITKIMVHEAVG